MHFGTKSYLKSTHNHTAKHALSIVVKTLVYLYKNENTSLIFRKHTYWKKQPQISNETNFII
jgi:hypothetical protein